MGLHSDIQRLSAFTMDEEGRENYIIFSEKLGSSIEKSNLQIYKTLPMSNLNSRSYAAPINRANGVSLTVFDASSTFSPSGVFTTIPQ